MASWDMEYCDPEQGFELSPEGLACVSSVKFAAVLEGGYEPLQILPS